MYASNRRGKRRTLPSFLEFEEFFFGFEKAWKKVWKSFLKFLSNKKAKKKKNSQKQKQKKQKTNKQKNTNFCSRNRFSRSSYLSASAGARKFAFCSRRIHFVDGSNRALVELQQA
jgi:hypothetical protein